MSKRYITKIAREVNKFTLQTMKEDGIGTAEFDFIHLLRHHPGLTQAQIREQLKIDKGAAARRAAALETKGYLVRKTHPTDRRSQLLFATEQADHLKNSKEYIEATFYDWLLEDLSHEECEIFCQILDKLYLRSKQEARLGFVHVKERIGETDNGREKQ